MPSMPAVDAERLLTPTAVKPACVAGNTSLRSAKIVSVTGQAFETALRVDITTPLRDDEGIRSAVNILLPKDVHAGDQIDVSYSVRSPNASTTNNHRAFVALKSEEPEWNMAFSMECILSSAWKKYHVKFVCGRNMKRGNGALTIQFTPGNSSFELANVYVRRLGALPLDSGLIRPDSVPGNLLESFDRISTFCHGVSFVANCIEDEGHANRGLTLCMPARESANQVGCQWLLTTSMRAGHSYRLTAPLRSRSGPAQVFACLQEVVPPYRQVFKPLIRDVGEKWGVWTWQVQAKVDVMEAKYAFAFHMQGLAVQTLLMKPVVLVESEMATALYAAERRDIEALP